MNLIFPLILSTTNPISKETEFVALDKGPKLNIKFNDGKNLEFPAFSRFENFNMFSKELLVFKAGILESQYFSLDYELKISFEEFYTLLEDNEYKEFGNIGDSIASDPLALQSNPDTINTLQLSQKFDSDTFLIRGIVLTSFGMEYIFNIFAIEFKIKISNVKSNFLIGYSRKFSSIESENEHSVLYFSYNEVNKLFNSGRTWSPKYEDYIQLINLISTNEFRFSLLESFKNFLNICKFNKYILFFETCKECHDISPEVVEFFRSLNIKHLEVRIVSKISEQAENISEAFEGLKFELKIV